MCCILCEEPLRSITFGLAALGVVSLVNGARKVLTNRADAAAAAADSSAASAPVLVSADSAQ